MSKKPIIGDLSLIQVAAGAVAAVTAAWLASTLGVAGTLIGAAVGSVVASISAAFVRHSLETGRDLVVVSSKDGGVKVEERPADEVDPLTRSPKPWFNWRTTLQLALVMLAIAITVIVGYEILSGQSFGESTNHSIVPGVQQPAEPTPTLTPTPSATPTTEVPTTEAPTTAAPTTDSPTTAAPTTATPTPTTAAGY